MSNQHYVILFTSEKLFIKTALEEKGLLWFFLTKRYSEFSWNDSVFLMGCYL